jgi:hypothetical protein
MAVKFIDSESCNGKHTRRAVKGAKGARSPLHGQESKECFDAGI